jgi:predicted signal transduction protein with EAL and GGDEF domain
LQGYYIFGALVAETILASVQIVSAQTGGHMDASDLTKALQNHLARRGNRAHIVANVGSSDLPLSARRSINLFNRLKRAKLCIGKVDRKDPTSSRLDFTAADKTSERSSR